MPLFATWRRMHDAVNKNNPTGEEVTATAERGGALFYGWVVVAAAFTGTFLAFGIAYSFGPFFPAIEAEFNASRTDVAAVSALSGGLLFGLGALSGPLADRIGPARSATFGMALVAIGLLAGARAESIWHLYLAYGLGIGIGTGFIYVPLLTTVQRWFVRRRGLASGLAVMGISAGTLVTPPFTNFLIQTYDWRQAMTTLGLIVAVLGIFAMLWLRRSPESMGLYPDGDPAPAPPAPGSRPGPAATLREAMAGPSFWLLSASGGLISFALFIPLIHLVPYTVDKGLGTDTGVWLISLIGVASLAGRFSVGFIADRIGRLETLIGVYAGMAVMLAFWGIADEPVTLVIFAVIFGILYGGFTPLMPAIHADIFGVRHLGTIMGVSYSGAGLGVMTGPTLAGLLFDLTGGYVLAIAAAAIAMAVGAICLAVVRARQPR